MNPNASESSGCHHALYCVTINFVLKERKQILQMNFTDTNQLFPPPNPYNHWIFEFQSKGEKISFIRI